MVKKNEINSTVAESLQRRANAIARKEGRGRATDIVVFNDDTQVEEVISCVDYGYRKHTTDEYVSKAYLRNFGWKNTYYQHAETTVRVHL
jgi:hypothetical protein